MPLIKSSSAQALRKNFEKLLKEGYSKRQAYAIAKRVQQTSFRGK